MREITYREGNHSATYVRISKARARKLCEEGKEVTIHPCNLSPESPWGYPPHLNWEPDQDFDKFVNAFEYYNCTNSETGYYAAFYAKVEEQKS